MATMFRISEQTGVSLRTLQKLHKAGYLKADKPDENDAAIQMRFYLSRRQSLSVAQLLALIDDQSIYGDLRRYAGMAREQVEALGNVAQDAAPAAVVASIDGASRNEPDAVMAVLEWLTTAIPAERGVPYHWLAIRLIFNAPPAFRNDDVQKLRRVFINVRRCEEFAGYWKTYKTGSRISTFYQKPLDL